jgi:HK97 family phage portal protein
MNDFLYTISRSISSLWARNSSASRNIGPQDPGPLTYAQDAAATVNFDSAMQVSAVWAAVRLIAETIASLPLGIYKVDKDGNRSLATDHDLYRVLTYKPNDYQSAIEFWETMIMNLVLGGNAYAVKVKSGNRIVGLLPLPTAQTVTSLLPDGSIVHTYTSDKEVRVYASESIWHLKLFGNGIIGLSTLAYARNSIGIAIASDNRVTTIYSNGAKGSGILSIDKGLTAAQRVSIKENFNGLTAGSQDRLYILEAGMKFDSISMSPQDIELLQSRRFQIEDIGRFFGVPSVLLNHTSSGSALGSNVSEIIDGFYKLNLRPYLEKIEGSIQRWLMPESELDKYEVEFNFDSLLRADVLKRMQAYREGINSGQITPNEARQIEGRIALEGGDQLLIQGAMIPIRQAGQMLNNGSNSATLENS